MGLFNLRPIIFGKLHTVEELKNIKNAIDSIGVRSKIPVLIIDNESFSYLEALRNEKFNIVQIDDIQDFFAVSEYQVVICDIKGVGRKFSKDKEGLYVVRQLKKLYPFKQIAVYSSGDFKIESMDVGKITVIKKDIDKDTWCDTIDQMIHSASDAVEVWKNIRQFLFDKDVSIKEVMFLEHNYVDIMLNRPTDLKNFPEHKYSSKISTDVQNVIQSMVAGVLLKCLGI